MDLPADLAILDGDSWEIVVQSTESGYIGLRKIKVSLIFQDYLAG